MIYVKKNYQSGSLIILFSKYNLFNLKYLILNNKKKKGDTYLLDICVAKYSNRRRKCHLSHLAWLCGD